jgi:CheY-like chemotaxis protein
MPANTAQRTLRTIGADAETAAADERRAPSAVSEIALDDVSILVIEDDDSDAELISEILRRMSPVGSLVRAVDGRQALDIVSESAFRPHLILLDLNMPRMNGFEFLAAAREIPLLRGVPVVVLTTSARYADVREALKGTASSYIVKPESLAELSEKIEKVLLSITRGDYLDRRI